MDTDLRSAVLKRADISQLRQLLAARPGYTTLPHEARTAIAAGVTDEPEARRVIDFI